MIRRGKFLFLGVIYFCMLFMCSCADADIQKYAGYYQGVRNSVLVLNEDGSCSYEETDRRKADGKWGIKDNKLIVLVDNLSYPIYAELDKNVDGSLHFLADDSNWREELFELMPATEAEEYIKKSYAEEEKMKEEKDMSHLDTCYSAFLTVIAELKLRDSFEATEDDLPDVIKEKLERYIDGGLGEVNSRFLSTAAAGQKMFFRYDCINNIISVSLGTQEGIVSENGTHFCVSNQD